MRRRPGASSWCGCIFLLLCSWGPQLSAAADRGTVVVDHRVFPGLHEMDGHWSALLEASDGKVYVGLALHGGDGHLVYYDPESDRVTDVGNLTRLVGETLRRQGPQSKIHTRFGEGKGGRIYFGTHAGHWWDYARFGTKEGYPGGHWMAFDPASGQVEDLGLAIAHDGIVTGAYDPVHHRLYGISYPWAHFIYHDVAGRRSVDKGRINNFDSVCRTLGVDDHGRVYGSFGRGQIFCYDPESDALTELAHRLPIREKGISLGRDYRKSESAWRVVVWHPDRKVFYGVEESASILFSFDPLQEGAGAVRGLRQISQAGFQDRRDVPYATLSLSTGPGGLLYYGAVGKEFDYSGSTGPAASHLITYDLEKGEMKDQGALTLRDGRPVLGTNAAHSGPSGNVYLVGAIEVKPEAGEPLKSGGKIGETPFRLALLIYRPE